MLRTNYAIHLDTSRDYSWRRILNLSVNDWRISAYSLIIVSVFLIIISNLAHGDDLTGLPQDDPKDISYTTAGPSAPPQTTGRILFVSMPGWAHGASMPPLPYQLTPMGKKPVTVATAVAAAPLAPPKETPASAAPAPEPKETVAKPAPAPESPALIAVSPFLQWIKSNPKAAEDARAQANASHAPTGPTNGANIITAGPAGNTNSEDPYWLPPLIDSADLGTAPVGGSAAIYSTPQR